MTYANWIQLGALLITILSLIWQQRKSYKESNLKEKRIETKLKILYSLIGKTDLKEEEIISSLGKGQPLSDIDTFEVRKALYEMLSDETIRLTSGGKYKPRERSPRVSLTQ